MNHLATNFNLWDLLDFSGQHPTSFDPRGLQQLPDYTSPPTEYSISLTPKGYQPDFVIDIGRNLASLGLCDEEENSSKCQILFQPSGEFEPSKLGVIFYGGALVDPRGYSPIAHQLSQRYGLPVSVPIFENDLAFDFTCNTRKVEAAGRAFPLVEKWVLAGHSVGGIAAMTDLFTILNKNDTDIGGVEGSYNTTGSSSMDDIAGLALIGSYIRQDMGCGAVDFSGMDLPAASIFADLDGVINVMNWEKGQPLLPVNDTQRINIIGGTHGHFGSYDDSERRTLLGQIDGNATIPGTLQHDMTVATIVHVASRAGLPLPTKKQKQSWSGESKNKSEKDGKKAKNNN